MSLFDLVKKLTLMLTFPKTENVGGDKVNQRANKSSVEQMAGRDIVNQHTQHKHPYIEISLGSRRSSQGTYSVDFILRNVGDLAAIIQTIEIGGEKMPIKKKGLAPGDPEYKFTFNIEGYKIRNDHEAKKNLILSYKDIYGQSYLTEAKIITEPTSTAKYNIKDIDDYEFTVLSPQGKKE